MRENRNLEFKQQITNSFLKTVCAFSNFGKGTILFGVDDEGKTVGISNPDQTCLDIENRINDNIIPKPNFSLKINHRTNVISLIVSEGKYKPYLYKGKAYRRSDTATIEVDQVELRRLTLEGENLYYEELPCKKDGLKFDYFESKLISILGITEITVDILRTFGFYNRDNHYNIAAALFSDVNSYNGIDAARFGNSISEILDRETNTNISILKQYDLAVDMFRRYYQYEKIEGIERKTIEIIPETAFREAVANAFVHRTWDVNANIRIFMFSDRIEIISPGGLPNGITKEEYLHGYISILRNPIIANVFFRLHLIEIFGTGIRRIIEAYADRLINPSFEITENSVKVTLPAINSGINLTADKQKVVALLQGGMILSSSEVAENLHWSRDKAIRELNSLIESGLIKKTGIGRGTRYGK